MSQEILEAKLEHLGALQEGLYQHKEHFLHARQQFDFLSVYEKSEPLVSICVGTCNRSKLLIERCLPSLLRQSYKNIQIIVVGDRATDDTEQRIAGIKDSRIIFENLSERGPYPPPGVDRWCVAGINPVNRALDLCEGDFILHLDDDDQATEDRVEKLVEFALRKKLEFIWHKFFYQKSDGIWITLGNENLILGQATTGSIFYHKYFSRIKWDIYAYRQKEPGDWNRIRKIKFMDPCREFLDQVLTIHYKERNQPVFKQQYNESFIKV